MDCRFFNKQVSTSVCDHVVLSASCHLYWIPPGVVLSSLLYIMYTDDCRSNQENSYLVKFADDNALLYLLLGTQDGHGAALSDFTEWCDDFTEWCDDFTEWCDDFTEWCDEAYLQLNVNQTKEMIADIRRRRLTDRAVEIHDEKVEIVHSYKHLGTIFEDSLKWDLNTEVITKKGHQRLHLLQKLKSFDADPTVLMLFCNYFIENV